MQTIKIFVAGSKRLSDERALFRVIASELQSEYSKIGKNINIQIETFETFDSFFSDSRKQEAYNEFIKKEADIVYFILDSEIGGVTEEEFNTAYSSFSSRRRPKICVFSKKSDKDNDEIKKVREKITLIGQYYNEYTDSNDLKSRIEKSLHFFINRALHPKNSIRSTLQKFILAAIALAALFFLLPYVAGREKSENGEGNGTGNPLEEGSIKTEKQNTIECIVNGVSFRMIEVPAGSFVMGGHDEDARMHDVTISDTFYIGSTEVTQELWNALMPENPSIFPGDSLPANNLSWNDCMQFIDSLNAKTGEHYRMPTEAEWEYAAQFGEKHLYSGHALPNEVSWFIGNSDEHVHAVGTKKPNAIGVHDMSGNVWEWCSDYYGEYNANDSQDPQGPRQGSLRVRRGGSYMDNSRCCQITFRSRNTPDSRRKNQGLRLVKEKHQPK